MSTIRWEIRGHVALGTIDRPEKRNALNAELCDVLRRHLDEEPGHRSVVITGAGSAFCAGADLVTRFAGNTAPGEPVDTFRPAFDALVEAIVAYAAPVIAAVNGPALGAGMQLAVACDLRVVARGAQLGVPAAKLGVHLSAPNIARLGLLCGQALARDVLLGGRVLTGEEAYGLGLAQRLADDALGGALEWSEELAMLAPLTLAGHKRALELLAAAQGYSPAQRAEVDACEARAFASRDLSEGIAAFTQRRAPDFHGR